ncbi:MAG: polysaccharide deacetylase family protein [Clostridia bacterium]|nr:polysaccharide deacetylase family protein [Clostridia bacterium]
MKRVFFCMIMLVLLLAAAAAEERPPMIALTFDDGPSEYTKEMLELLKKMTAELPFL